MQAIQLLIGGGEEKDPGDEAGSFASFRKTSRTEEGLLLPRQAGEALGVSKQAVQDLILRGKLTAFTFFGKTFVSAREVVARIESPREKGGRPRKQALQAA